MAHAEKRMQKWARRRTWKRTRTLMIVMGFALSVGSGASAWSADKPGASTGGGGNMFVGLLAGITMPSTSSAAVTIGVQGGLKPIPGLAVGPFYERFSVGLDAADSGGVNSVHTESATSYYGLEGALVVPNLTGFNAGMRIGMISTSTSAVITTSGGTTTISTSSSGLGFAPKIGYEMPTGPFSLGVEISYWLGMKTGLPKGPSAVVTGKFWF